MDKILDVAYGNYGLAALEIKDYDQARRLLKTALKLDPEEPIYHNSAGILYSELQFHPTALEFFNRAIQIDPNQPDSYSNRGLVHLQMNHRDQAI